MKETTLGENQKTTGVKKKLMNSKMGFFNLAVGENQEAAFARSK